MLDLRVHFKSPKCKFLNQPDVIDKLHKLYTNYIFVPADRAANNVIVACKKYYNDTLVEELGIDNLNNDDTIYFPTDDSYEAMLKSQNQFMTSLGLEMSEKDPKGRSKSTVFVLDSQVE